MIQEREREREREIRKIRYEGKAKGKRDKIQDRWIEIKS